MWQYATRTITIFINYTSRAGRITMKVTENGIYYVNRAVRKAQMSVENRRSHQPILKHWGGWARQNKSEQLM